MASWEVTCFQIRTGTPELTSGTLNADGKMQLPVYVSIKANIKGTDDHYYLTEGELNSIELVDFGYANDQLSDGWSYSHEQDLSTSMSIAPPSRVSDHDNVGDDYQLKRFWVSTTKAEEKNIAACIAQPDGKIVTTETSTEGSYVKLAGSTTTILEVAREVTICRPAVLF